MYVCISVCIVYVYVAMYVCIIVCIVYVYVAMYVCVVLIYRKWGKAKFLWFQPREVFLGNTFAQLYIQVISCKIYKKSFMVLFKTTKV